MARRDKVREKRGERKEGRRIKKKSGKRKGHGVKQGEGWQEKSQSGFRRAFRWGPSRVC